MQVWAAEWVFLEETSELSTPELCQQVLWTQVVRRPDVHGNPQSSLLHQLMWIAACVIL